MSDTFSLKNDIDDKNWLTVRSISVLAQCTRKKTAAVVNYITINDDKSITVEHRHVTICSSLTNQLMSVEGIDQDTLTFSLSVKRGVFQQVGPRKDTNAFMVIHTVNDKRIAEPLNIGSAILLLSDLSIL